MKDEDGDDLEKLARLTFARKILHSDIYAAWLPAKTGRDIIPFSQQERRAWAEFSRICQSYIVFKCEPKGCINHSRGQFTQSNAPVFNKNQNIP